MLEEKALIVDLGTTNLRVALSVLKGNQVKETYIKSVPSRGIKNGNISNTQLVTDCIKSVVNKLKVEAPTTVPKEAYVIVPGVQTISFSIESKISFPAMKTISYNDVNVVKNKAKEEFLRNVAGPLKIKYDVLHIIPQDFKVDGTDGIQNPIGYSGKELTIKALIVIANKSFLKTVNSILVDSGLKFKGGIAQALAASYAIRGENTYLNNNLLIYMGGGNTEVLYFKEDKPYYYGHVPFGGEDILKFISLKLKVSRTEAERLYKEYGSAYALDKDANEIITINHGNRFTKIPKILISILIHLKLKEAFKDIIRKLKEFEEKSSSLEIEVAEGSLIKNLNRIYLVGGLSKLNDITKTSHKVFKTPSVVPELTPSCNNDPALAPVVGAAHYLASLHKREKLTDIKEDLTKNFDSGKGLFSSIWRFISELI
jgi:cell division protein FtsA